MSNTPGPKPLHRPRCDLSDWQLQDRIELLFDQLTLPPGIKRLEANMIACTYRAVANYLQCSTSTLSYRLRDLERRRIFEVRRSSRGTIIKRPMQTMPLTRPEITVTPPVPAQQDSRSKGPLVRLLKRGAINILGAFLG